MGSEKEDVSKHKGSNDGNIVNSEERRKELAVNTYKKCLDNWPMKDELKHIKESKENLAKKLMEVPRNNKTPPWTMKNLDPVLKQLKKNKSRDPYEL